MHYFCTECKAQRGDASVEAGNPERPSNASPPSPGEGAGAGMGIWDQGRRAFGVPLTVTLLVGALERKGVPPRGHQGLCGGSTVACTKR